MAKAITGSFNLAGEEHTIKAGVKANVSDAITDIRQQCMDVLTAHMQKSGKDTQDNVDVFEETIVVEEDNVDKMLAKSASVVSVFLITSA